MHFEKMRKAKQPGTQGQGAHSMHKGLIRKGTESLVAEDNQKSMKMN